MNIAEIGLGFLSGLLSILSPCVLPLLPIVMASAANAHRHGGLALGLGLTLSFTVLGLFIATIGIGLGLDGDWFRRIAAMLLLAFGLILLIPALYLRFNLISSQLLGKTSGFSNTVSGKGWLGQFMVGLILGMVWTPCVGPTLGAAATLASASHDLGRASLIMLSFGLGASLPLVILGSVSRQAFMRLRGGLSAAAARGKQALGALLLIVGVGILSGYDRHLEQWLVSVSPDWLTTLTTHF